MRIHYSFYVAKLLRDLGENGIELRRAVESLLQNPRPEWGRAIPDRPGFYEFPIAERWIVYEIDETGGETVLRVTVITE